MKNKTKMPEYFAEAEKTEEHNGYSFSVGEALTIVILGSFCGLKKIKLKRPISKIFLDCLIEPAIVIQLNNL